MTNNLADTAKTTSKEILSTQSLLSFLASNQQKTLGSLPEGVRHLAKARIQSYVDERIPTHTGPPWSPQALDIAISKGLHASTCNPEMTMFVWGEMQSRIKDGFRILLPAEDAVRIF